MLTSRDRYRRFIVALNAAENWVIRVIRFAGPVDVFLDLGRWRGQVSTWSPGALGAGASVWAYVLVLGLALSFTSCSSPVADDSEPSGRAASVAQALTDTDGDGMDDDWEILHFGNLSQTAAGDFDSDGMTNGEEHTYGFDPTTADAFDDADGDRYPNIFEIRSGSDPNSAASVPTPTFVVNGAGGGTHTTVSAAVSAANGQSNNYPIIGIAPGVYAGSGNVGITASLSTKRLLIIGLEGAAKTVIDGGGTGAVGWYVSHTAIVSSLTFRRASPALYVSTSSAEARFIDLLVRDNTSASYPAGLYVGSAAKTYIVGSTFLNNTGYVVYGEQIYIGSGAATILNTVVWGQSSGPMLVKASGASLTTNHCLVKGQTLSGTGNLAGTTDPKLRSDGRLLWDSPLRAAGGSVVHSRIDMDGELRPASTPDIGVDQFFDSDADELADRWELDRTGGLTTLTGRAQDADGDGLTNEQEYVNDTLPTVGDTDGDGLSDGDEVTVHGTSPLKTDTDGDAMPDAWEVAHGLQPLTPDAFDDADGDRFPNVFEYAYSTDPSDRGSIPTPTLVVNGAGGGTHTTVNAAVNAANAQSGTYQIIGIAPGVYTGTGNLNIQASSSTKRLLIIGLEGAAKTIIDGGGSSFGWYVYYSTIISSLTFRRAAPALYVNTGSGTDVRLVDLLVRDNASSSYAGGVHVAGAPKTSIVGSTFLNNTGPSFYAAQIYIGSGGVDMLNTVVWGQSSGPMLVKASGASLTTNHCLVKGQTLSGSGNLAGTTDPKLRSDGRLLWDSPLRAAGGSVVHSRIDMDGELRPASTPDIGVDQFFDSDADDLADRWELDRTGGLTTLTSRAQDADGDGLTNELEYANDTLPTVGDTDGDGLSDGDEVTVHGTSPLKTDTDGDEMPDAWEVAHGLQPLTPDAFDDADGDRFPNVYEYIYSTDASDRESRPTPTFVVNGAGGGTHTSINAAFNAAGAQSGAYPIIGIAPGVYTGAANVGISLSLSTKKALVIGLEGAARTIVDGGGTALGWSVYSPAIISSLTFRRTTGAIYVSSPSSEVRLIDLLVKENASPSYASGVHVYAVAKTYIVGSTFLNNTGYPSYGEQVYIGSGAATIVNTVVWGQSSGPMLVKASAASLTTNHCLVTGQSLSGTGNLPGTTAPKLRADGHLFWDSPLRGAGGTVVHSRIDIDGELRPASTPDMGVDQFNDSDADELADGWELERTGNLTTLTSQSQDLDGDGLTNEQEYVNDTFPTVGDTDGDGLSDGDEVTVHGTSPLKTDTDADEMPDAWEVAHGLQPLTPDAFDDADGDRFPNVYEYVYSTDASDRESRPTPTFVVNGAGGGTHTSINAAFNAAGAQSGAYPIIGIAPGVYTGAANVGISLSLSTKKALVIGLEGAARTIVDGGGTALGWSVYSPAIISSLTFRRTTGAIYVSSPSSEVRLIDLLVKENASLSYASGVHVYAVAKTYIVGSTFLNNTGILSYGEQVYIGSGAATIVNTVVWGQSFGPMLGKTAGASVTTDHCLVKGETLSGTGNLSGTVNPLIHADGRLRSDSPLRGAGMAIATSAFDMELEVRPSVAPDVGVDQWVDVDADGAADGWEIASYGNTASFLGTADDDSDGLNNAGEYDWETDRLNPDTDGDGVLDGFEVGHGMNPIFRDADELGIDQNADGIIESIGLQLGYSSYQTDNDGDSISNAEESLICSDVLRSDSDGDGVPDNVDPFPLDPLMGALSANLQDVTPPMITLTAPWYAVEQ